MKMSLILFAFVSSFSLGLSASAEGMSDMAIAPYAGLNFSEFKTASSGSFDRAMGFDLGAEVFFPINGMISFRTGGGIATKNSTYKSGSTSIDMKFMYLEIPATAYFEFNESAAIYGGLNFDLKLSDSCSGSGISNCTVTDAKSLVYNLVIGGRFNVGGPHNIEVPLEFGLGDMAKDLKLSNSIGVRYAYSL